MNRLLLAAVSVVALLTGASSTASQDYPYCLQGVIWGYPGNCQFTNYEQCMATASGTNAYCGIDPRFSFVPPARWPRGSGHAQRYSKAHT